MCHTNEGAVIGPRCVPGAEGKKIWDFDFYLNLLASLFIFTSGCDPFIELFQDQVQHQEKPNAASDDSPLAGVRSGRGQGNSESESSIQHPLILNDF
jgi:hypothetical protein